MHSLGGRVGGCVFLSKVYIYAVQFPWRLAYPQLAELGRHLLHHVCLERRL